MKRHWISFVCSAVLIVLWPVSLRAQSMREWSEQEQLKRGSDSRTRIAIRAIPPEAHHGGKFQALSTSTFEGFVHCPAELGQQCTDPFGSIPMTANTAFYRDVIVGALTFVSGATDGESWTSTFTDPNNRALNFSGFTFHSNFNGDTNCFVSPFQVVCGTTSIEILWFLQSQCQPTGTWTATFSNTNIGPQTFTFKPQIDADTYLPLQRQSDYPNDPSGVPTAPYTNGPNPYDEICRTNTPGNRNVIFCPVSTPVPATQARWSIANKGCYMSDVSMVLTYHGLTTNPSTLNGILTGLGRNGFSTSGDVIPEGAANYARQHNVNISYPAPPAGSLSQDICTYGPQLVRVPPTIRTQHWVTAYGVKTDGTILVRDPSSGLLTQLSSIQTERRFSGPAFNFVDQITGMRFTFHSPIEPFITDPTGRREGFDPITQTSYDEIPNAYYDNDVGQFDDETGLPDPNPRKSLEVFGDIDGDYLLTVTGTATGTYDAEIWTIDNAGNMPRTTLDQIPTAPNVVQTYLFHFDHTNAANSTLGGAFDGGGQRPRDVNKFLTYGNPSAPSTTLPAGTRTFPLVIFYSQEVLPATFSANLNGVDVTALFHPAASAKEVVNLTLPAGKSVLKLSVDGQLASRVATDSDRLVLQVQ